MTDAPNNADETPPSGLLERSIRIIEGVVDAGTPVGPRALARAADIDRSSVGRILQQFATLDVLTREDSGYVPGPRLFSIARALASLDTLLDAANTVLADLVAQFDETCYICVLHEDTAVFLYERQSSQPLRYVIELGKPVPLYAGAAGRAILSGLDRCEAKRLLGTNTLPALTVHTITDPAKLLSIAEDDRIQGYSMSREERFDGGVAIASPFFNASDECQGSVVFTEPLSRFDESRASEIGNAVNAAAMMLSARLGSTINASPDHRG